MLRPKGHCPIWNTVPITPPQVTVFTLQLLVPSYLPWGVFPQLSVDYFMQSFRKKNVLLSLLQFITLVYNVYVFIWLMTVSAPANSEQLEGRSPFWICPPRTSHSGWWSVGTWWILVKWTAPSHSLRKGLLTNLYHVLAPLLLRERKVSRLLTVLFQGSLRFLVSATFSVFPSEWMYAWVSSSLANTFLNVKNKI